MPQFFTLPLSFNAFLRIPCDAAAALQSGSFAF